MPPAPPLVPPQTHLSPGDGFGDALLLAAETGAAPAHGLEQLVALVGLVQTLGDVDRRRCAAEPAADGERTTVSGTRANQ